MSRISYNDDWDTDSILARGRWERNSRQVLTSRRGQRALRELEAALLALPQPRLVSDTFCNMNADGEYEACVLGAYALYKGHDPNALFEIDTYWEGASEQADWAESNLGLAYTLAWNLIELNDERFGKATPEERHIKFLAWVRNQLQPVESEV